MNIGILCAKEEKNIAGINRFILNVVNNQLKLDHSNVYYSLEDNYLKFPIQAPTKFLKSIGNAYRDIFCECEKIDIIHSYYNIFGKLNYKCKKIFTIYDLIPLIHPEWFDVSSFEYYDNEIRQAAYEADVVIAISEATKEDIIRLYNIPEKKIKVVYPGLCSQILPLKFDHTVIDKYSLESGYLLSVSTLEPRKNLIKLINSFIQFKTLHSELELKLVLVGQYGWDKEINKFLQSIGKHVESLVFTGYVTDDVLSVLYGNALAVVYISLYEGFGLPVLEAMAAGKAVISSDVSSLPEVGGDSVMYCDPYDSDSIMEAIERVVFDQDLRQTLEKKAITRARLFSFEKAASEITEIYRSFE